MKETKTEISHWIQAWMFSGSFLTDELLRSNAKIIIMFHLLQVIAAEGEMNASRALKEAADIISESTKERDHVTSTTWPGGHKMGGK